MLVVLLVSLAAVEAAESNDIGELEDPGTCVCDLTSDGCDSFCCCDSDCSDETIAEWESDDPEKDLCVQSRFSGSGFEHCVSESEFFRENSRRGMGEPTTRDDQVCIEVDNSAELTEFHPLRSDDDIHDDTIEERLEDNVEYSDLLAFDLLDIGSSYTAGEPVPALLNNQQQLGGIWPVPGPDAFGYCADMTPARWMISESHRSCLRQLTRSDVCDTTLAVATYTSSLGVLINPAADVFTYATVSVSSMRKRDMVTLAETSTEANSTTSESGTECLNAVLEVHYRVTLGTDDEIISAVSAELVVTDLDLDSNDQLSQQFSIGFYTGEGAYGSRSGNPGYHVGLPVITSSSSYNIHDDGFALGGTNADGSCAATDTSNALSPLLRFGQDTIVTCYREFTRTELSSACSIGNTDLPIFSAHDDLVYIAKFGNIDSSEPDDWVTVEIDDSFSNILYDSSTATCTVPNTMVYDIYYTYTGAVSNPQPKIIAAKRSYTQSTVWKFAGLSDAATQKFLNSVVVNFIQYDETDDFYERDRDEDIKMMPDDVLYLLRASASTALGLGLIGLFLA